MKSLSRGTILSVAVVLAVGVFETRAQQPAAESLKFEVATIKSTDPNEQGMRFMVRPGGKLSVLNMTLKNLISSAYEVHEFQVIGGPKWIDTDRFDIEAKLGDSTTVSDLKSMTDAQQRGFRNQMMERVRSLLADRFQLVVRRETKEMPVYTLVVAKSGSKLKPVEPKPGQDMGTRGSNGVLKGLATPTQSIADNLSTRLGRPVIDRTNLAGKYDWRLEWSDQPAAAADVSGPSIFTAVQEQLGLRLESQKAPAPVIIVESASKPSAN